MPITCVFKANAGVLSGCEQPVPRAMFGNDFLLADALGRAPGTVNFKVRVPSSFGVVLEEFQDTVSSDTLLTDLHRHILRGINAPPELTSYLLARPYRAPTVAVTHSCSLRVSDLCYKDEETGELHVQDGSTALIRLYELPGVGIVSLTGRRYEIDVDWDADITVAELKASLQDDSGIPADQVRFIFGGKQLADSEELRVAGVLPGARIEMVLRLRGD